MQRLKEKYLSEVREKLQQEFGLKNHLAVPRIKKIVINIGLGEAKDNAGILDKVKVYFAALAGQLPVVTLAKKSIASFKVVKGQPIGMMVTIRGDKMYAFLDKLISIVLPKVRDFKGISEQSFDAAGNLNMGLKEQVIFPEVDYKTVDRTRGLAVTITTSASNRKESKKLLEYLGMPFRN
ncbi:MAG: 50S ribosomal protein L5 [Candidatus Daviesbacteria bacterium]|nr:50S ribosomal protein L5 [Candidatus Daviesbacteria bacterium]